MQCGISHSRLLKAHCGHSCRSVSLCAWLGREPNTSATDQRLLTDLLPTLEPRGRSIVRRMERHASDSRLSWMWWLLGLLAVLHVDIQYTGVQAQHRQEISQEYCLLETFEGRCNGSDVIFMKSAYYGRMRPGRCIDGSLGHMGCAKDILSFVDRACSGRQSCTIKVTDLRIFTPCSQELFTYLDVFYTCQPVTAGGVDDCSLLNETRVLATSGVLSGETAYHGPSGTAACPWSFGYPQGQRVRITLFDFTLRDMQIRSLTDGVSDSLTCAASLRVWETDDITSTIELCDGSLRQRHVYTSLTNQVRLVIKYHKEAKDVPYFLLSYEAVGCPFFDPPANMRMSLNADVATVVCNFTGETWYIICRATSWIGELGNCTRGTPAPPFQDTASFPWGVVIAVAIGVGLGTVVGLTLLGIVFLCRRCICPAKQPQRVPSKKGPMNARDVPPMNELIRSATAMAKHGDPRAPHPGHPGLVTYQGGHVMQHVTAQIEYKPEDMTHSRQRSKEEHIYESYIYKDGTLLRKDSASESTGSGYCDVEGSVISDFPGGPPHILPPGQIVHALGQTTAHPVGGAELSK